MNDEPTNPQTEIERLRRWVSDLQSGMYVNCVYCGHRYGPNETMPVSMADALKAHIEQCPQHPMSVLKAENERLRDFLNETFGAVCAAELWDDNPWWKTYWLPKLEQIAPSSERKDTPVNYFSDR